MKKNICEVCGHTSLQEALEAHHVVPKEFTSKAGMPESSLVLLCTKCHKEILDWYNKRIFDMTYDPETQKFRPKSPSELAKEHEIVYKAFVRYKKEQQKGA